MKPTSGGCRFGDIRLIWRLFIFCIHPFANMLSALQAISQYFSPCVIDEEMEAWRAWWLRKVIEQEDLEMGLNQQSRVHFLPRYSSVP